MNFQTNLTPYDVTGGLTVDGGTVTFGSGDTAGGSVSVSAGTATFGSGSALVATATVAMSGTGATLDLITGATVTIASLSITSNVLGGVITLAGSDNLTVTNATSDTATNNNVARHHCQMLPAM